MATTPTPQDVLAVPLAQPNDAGAATIRDYLVALLATLWTEGEGFSGKRPFGNSNWQNDLYRALVTARYIAGTLDEDGYLEEADDEAGDQLVADALQALGQPVTAAPPIDPVAVQGMAVQLTDGDTGTTYCLDRVQAAHLADSADRRTLRIMQALLTEAQCTVNEAFSRKAAVEHRERT